MKTLEITNREWNKLKSHLRSVYANKPVQILSEILHKMVDADKEEEPAKEKIIAFELEGRWYGEGKIKATHSNYWVVELTMPCKEFKIGTEILIAFSEKAKNLPEYVIRLNEFGYFGKIPYTAVSLEDAIAFPTMRKARAKLNRLNGQLWKAGESSIELRSVAQR